MNHVFSKEAFRALRVSWALLALALEREAEERVDQAELCDRHGDRDERGEGLDDAVVGRPQVVGVERQQEERREARDHGSEPVHERLPSEAQETARGARRRGRRSHLYDGSSHSTCS